VGWRGGGGSRVKVSRDPLVLNMKLETVQPQPAHGSREVCANPATVGRDLPFSVFFPLRTKDVFFKGNICHFAYKISRGNKRHCHYALVLRSCVCN
jgi:hypothetical protein